MLVPSSHDSSVWIVVPRFTVQTSNAVSVPPQGCPRHSSGHSRYRNWNTNHYHKRGNRNVKVPFSVHIGYDYPIITVGFDWRNVLNKLLLRHEIVNFCLGKSALHLRRAPILTPVSPSFAICTLSRHEVKYNRRIISEIFHKSIPLPGSTQGLARGLTSLCFGSMMAPHASLCGCLGAVQLSSN